MLPLRLVLLFGFYLVAGNFVLALPKVDRGFISPWTGANAAAAAALTSLLGYDAQVTGTILSSGSTSLDIRKGCDGVHATLILVSAVLAFPARWTRRLFGLVLGTVAIFGFNILRLVSLLLIALHFPTQLEFFHVYVWQTLICLLALGTFLFWGTYLTGEG